MASIVTLHRCGMSNTSDASGHVPAHTRELRSASAQTLQPSYLRATQVKLFPIVFLQEFLQQIAAVFADAHDLRADTRFSDVLDLNSTVQKLVRVKLAFEVEELADRESLSADNEETLSAEILQQTRD
ncbi:MAG TPA: hypothetical protein VGC70_01585 [Burkholderiales bacterium]